MTKKGVWRDIKFPCSSKSMYIPNTPDTKDSVVAIHIFTEEAGSRKLPSYLQSMVKEYQQSIWELI